MRLRVLFSAILFSFLVFPFAEAKVFGAKEFILDNGLRLIVVENNKAPLAAQFLCYHVGRIDEPKGKSGLAHLLEHMMFKGTGFSEAIDRLGGSDNAFTTNDMTCYHQRVASRYLETVMAMEANRMRRLSFSESDFADEKKVVIEERVERTDSRPEGAFRENSARIFYEDSPYAVPTIGFMDEIKSLTSGNIKSFYQMHYIPKNAVLAISGDIDAITVKRWADKYYGTIKKRDYQTSHPVPDKDYGVHKYTQELRMKHGNVSRPQLTLRFHAPSFFTPGVDLKNIYALDVFAESTGGSIIGKLYQKLVVDEKLLISVSASYSPYSRLSSEFVVSAIPADGYDREKIVLRILAVLNEDLTSKEIDRVRDRMKIDMTYLAEKPLSGAEVIAPIAVNGVPLDEVENYIEHLYAFSTDELNRYKKELLKYPFVGWLEQTND